MLQRASGVAVSVTAGMLVLDWVMGRTAERWYTDTGEFMSSTFFLFYGIVFGTALLVSLFWEWVKERPPKK